MVHNTYRIFQSRLRRKKSPLKSFARSGIFKYVHIVLLLFIEMIILHEYFLIFVISSPQRTLWKA